MTKGGRPCSRHPGVASSSTLTRLLSRSNQFAAARHVRTAARAGDRRGAGRELQRRAHLVGVQLVVVTRGSEGAVGWTGSARVEAAPVPVDVVDTVGAGDTFQAALICWLAENAVLSRDGLQALHADRLRAALQFAARAAAITCSRRGADMPRRRELV